MSIANKLDLPKQPEATGGLFKGSPLSSVKAVLKTVTSKLNALEISFTVLASISFIGEAFGRRMSFGPLLLLVGILIVIAFERYEQNRNQPKP